MSATTIEPNGMSICRQRHHLGVIPADEQVVARNVQLRQTEFAFTVSSLDIGMIRDTLKMAQVQGTKIL